jgi:hypothetical protein
MPSFASVIASARNVDFPLVDRELDSDSESDSEDNGVQAHSLSLYTKDSKAKTAEDRSQGDEVFKRVEVVQETHCVDTAVCCLEDLGVGKMEKGMIQIVVYLSPDLLTTGSRTGDVVVGWDGRRGGDVGGQCLFTMQIRHTRQLRRSRMERAKGGVRAMVRSVKGGVKGLVRGVW